MNGRFRKASLTILVLLAVFCAASPAPAREAEENASDSVEPSSDRGLVYDYKTGKFVRVHQMDPSQYRIGRLKMDVGYDEEIHRSKEAWPPNVYQFLFKRPL